MSKDSLKAIGDYLEKYGAYKASTKRIGRGICGKKKTAGKGEKG